MELSHELFAFISENQPETVKQNASVLYPLLRGFAQSNKDKDEFDGYFTGNRLHVVSFNRQGSERHKTHGSEHSELNFQF